MGDEPSKIEGGDPSAKQAVDSNRRDSELLRKEQDEINQWLRASIQIYFAWYTVYVTTSCAALIWMFGKDSASYDAHLVIYGIAAFLLLAYLSLPAPFTVAAYLSRMHKRIEAIYRITQEGVPAPYVAKSPVPITMLIIGVYLTAGAILTMCVLWSRMLCVHIYLLRGK
jgi:hypothetical protein